MALIGLVVLGMGTMGDASLSPTDELLRMTVDEITLPSPLNLARVKVLVSQGADLTARNRGGGYPFLLAAETYSYLATSTDTVDTKVALDIANYLISQGSDVSSSDGRGFTPAMYLVRF